MAMKAVVSLSARSDIASPVDTDAKPAQKKVIELTLQELSSRVIAELAPELPGCVLKLPLVVRLALSGLILIGGSN